MRRRGHVPRELGTRSVRVARVAGPHATRHAMTRVTNVLRDDRGASAQLARVHRESAVAAAELLGGLKGGAMKLGQLASYVELEFIPAEYRELYQSELAALRDAAPPMSWETIHEVLAVEWGRPPEEVLEIETDAVAAASIGQVHRGVLADGREVAVKVQYPGVASAVEADVRTALVLMRAWRGLDPGLGTSSLATELRDRVLEELDYRLEAENQAVFADAYRGHPFVHVPAPVPELCTALVLVTEWVDGAPFAAIRELPQADRDRFAEMLFRFYLGSMDVVGRFNADPHPGNFLLLADGRAAILDFGAVKRITPAFRERMNSLAIACSNRDGVRVRELMSRLGWFEDPASIDPGALVEAVFLSSGWLLENRAVRLTPEYVRARLELLLAPGGDLYDVLRRASLPPDELWFRRLENSLLAVLAQLRASGHWHRAARELWFGEPPATELGRLEWEFFDARPLWRDPRTRLRVGVEGGR